MVTVLKRPTGHKIIDQAITATIINSFPLDSENNALVNFPNHGLSTGGIVYITSDIDEYNGFWSIVVFDVDHFYITEYVSVLAAFYYVEFYQEIDIEYFQTQPHDWSSIFLPIVYKLTNDRWPVNSVDTARTVSSQSDDNSFTNLNLSGVLKSSFNALEFVKISGASDEDLNAVWQIVEVVSTSDITINLPYSASNSFTGATVQYYYNNYQVKVKITAGLNASHPWASKKPYAEVAELSLTPDDNNEVMFSVSDYITSKVAIKNNLTLFSLPLNLDAFTQFYISTAESYDDSDNYSLTTFESEFTDDSFEGYAIAGKLPFKNLYSGDYADYVYTPGSPAMWLTLMTRLLAVDGLFFDVSFIKNTGGDFIARFTKYISDYGITEDVPYTDQGIGVYRIPVTADANYDSLCVKILASSDGITLDNSDFQNYDDASTAWTTGSSPSVTRSSIGSTDTLYIDYAFIVGVSYTVIANLSVSGTATGQIVLKIEDSSFNTVFIDFENFSGSGAEVATETFVATEDTSKITISATWTSNDSATVTLVSVQVTSDELQITEEICIDILESCEVQNGFIPDDARLLEDGDYRLLE